MTPSSLLFDLRSHGVEVTAADGMLRVRVLGALPDVLRDRLKASRDAVLDHLTTHPLHRHDDGTLTDRLAALPNGIAVISVNGVAIDRAEVIERIFAVAKSATTGSRLDAMPEIGRLVLSIAGLDAQQVIAPLDGRLRDAHADDAGIWLDDALLSADDVLNWARTHAETDGSRVVVDHLNDHPQGLLQGIATLLSGAILDLRDPVTIDGTIDHLSVASSGRLDAYRDGIGDRTLASVLDSGVDGSARMRFFGAGGMALVQRLVLPDDARDIAVRRFDADGTEFGWDARPITVVDAAGLPAMAGATGELALTGAGGVERKLALAARRRVDGSLDLVMGKTDVLIGGRRVSPSAAAEAVEGAIDVRAAHAAVRTGIDGTPRLVVWAVPATRMSYTSLVDAVVDRVSRVVPDGLDWRLAPVTSLPLTNDGHVDIEQLATVPCIDPASVRRWTADAADDGGVLAVVPTIPSRGVDYAEADLLLRSIPVAVEDRVDEISDVDALPAIVHAPPIDPPVDLPLTLPGVLRRAASGGTGGITLIDATGTTTRMSYPTLLEQSLARAGGLADAGIAAGDRILIQATDIVDLLTAFWACFMRGAVPLALDPVETANPDAAAGALVLALTDTLQPAAILASSAAIPLIGSVFTAADRSLPMLVDISALPSTGVWETDCEPAPDDLALFFPTSGTTGRPKLVQQTHGNLVLYGFSLGRFMSVRSDDVTFNWMPLDHAGAFAHFHMRDLVYAVHQVHADKAHILEAPLRWIDYLSDYKATITWSPNFSYRLVTDALGMLDSTPSWDLTSLRNVTNGGEMISAASARAFIRNLKPFGLPQTAMVPAWGMSETGSGMVFDLDFDIDGDGTGPVRIGTPIDGGAIRIVRDDGTICRRGTETGHYEVHGDFVTPGYFNDPVKNAESFTADGWLRTGDYARIDAAGGLFITGRSGNTIIVNGINRSCQEIEDAVERLADIVSGGIAACPIREPGDDTDAIALFVCLDGVAKADLPARFAAVREAMVSATGLAPRYIVPIAYDRFPRTSLGKIQRGKLRQQLERGELDTELRKGRSLDGRSTRIPNWFHGRRWILSEGRETKPSPIIWIGSEDGIATVRGLPGWRDTDVALPVAGTSDRSARVRALAAALDDRPDCAVIVDATLVDAEDDAGLASYAVTAMQAWHDLDRPDMRYLFGTPGALRIDERAGTGATSAASAAAIVRVAIAETGQSGMKLVDVDPRDFAATASALLAEAGRVDGDREVAWRGDRRFVPRFERVRIDRPAKGAALSREGLVLLAGRWEEPVHAVARWLARHDAATLILVDMAGDDGGTRLRRQADRLRAEGLKVETIDEPCPSVDTILAAVVLAEATYDTSLSGLLYFSTEGGDESASHRVTDIDPPAFDVMVRNRRASLAAPVSAIVGRPDVPLIVFTSVSTPTSEAGAAMRAIDDAARAGIAAERIDRGGRAIVVETGTWLDSITSTRSDEVMAMTTDACMVSVSGALVSGRSHVIIGMDGSQQSMLSRALRAPEAAFAPVIVRPTAATTTSNSVSDLFGVPVPVDQFVDADPPRREDGGIDAMALVASKSLDDLAAPRGETEQALATIWCALLKVGAVERTDHFFAIGGNSILATQLLLRIADRFDVSLKLSDLLAAPTIQTLAVLLDASRRQAVPAAPVLAVQPDPAACHEPFPLTDIQQAYWVGRSGAFDGGAIGTQCYFEIDGPPLDVDRFHDALNALIARHSMLRMVVDDSGMQRILADTPAYRLKIDDWRSLDETDRDAALSDVRHTMSERIFDTGQWPLFELRAGLIDDDLCRLHVTIDTMIVDGSSYHILFNDLAALYRGEGDDLPPLELTFRDYIMTIEGLKTTPAYETARRYWLDRIDTLPPAPGLPLVADPGRIAIPRIGRYAAELSPETWRAVTTNARQHGVTPSMALAAVYAEVLRCWSGDDRLTLNLTVFNRLPVHPQIGMIVGDFTATSLLEADGGEATFAGRVSALQKQMWRDMDHRLFTGVEVLREIARRRHDSTGAAMPVVFTSALSVDGERGDGERVPSQDELFNYVSGRTAQVWLDFQVMEDADGLKMVLDAVEDIFPAGMVDGLFAAIHALATRLADPATWTQTRFPLVPGSQLAVRGRRNATAVEWALRPLAAFVDDIVGEGSHPAVIDGDRTIDRATFVRWTRRLAARLQRHGVVPGDLVAIEMDRGWRQVVAAAAICLSGGAYVPIDARLPLARRQTIIDQTEARIILRDDRSGRSEDRDGDGPLELAIGTELLDSLPDDAVIARATLDDLAYVIFTSGSTGTPKGVVIDHRGAANTIRDVNTRLDVTGGDRILALSALGFDLSVYDIFGVLDAGGVVVIPDADKAHDPEHWETVMRTHGVTLFNGVPALMQILVDHLEVAKRPMPASLRVALLSGDWIPVALPDRIRDLCTGAIDLYSLGGATEASIWSVIYPIGAVDPGWDSIPYGVPMANQQMLVLDAHMNDVPNGVAGDLYIGGMGLAKGYWRDAPRTAAAFVSHPDTGAPLYRTGDRAAYRADGVLEFRGRIDTQVKLRGHRIELGEIEAVISAVPGARACVAHVHRTDVQNPQIGAHVVLAADADPQAVVAAARGAVVSRLPSYMAPAFIAIIDAVPLSANGKVDRGRLTSPVATTPTNADPIVFDERAAVLAQLWNDVLGHRPTLIDDHFFDLGGNSVSMLRLIARLRAQGQTVDVRRFFEMPTLRGMLETLADQAGTGTDQTAEHASIRAAARRGRIAAWIETLDAAEKDRLAEELGVPGADIVDLGAALAGTDIVVPEDVPVPLSFEQERMWFGAKLRDDGQYNLFQALTLPDPIAPDALAAALNTIVARHASLRTRFVETDAGLRQVVRPAGTDGLFYLSILDRPNADETTLATELLDREAAWRFDLANGPLLRVTLARGADDVSLIAFNLHHIACDGWSIANFVTELSLIGSDRTDALPDLSLSYADFALWQRAWLSSAEYDRQLDHWRARLAQLPTLDLPPPASGPRGEDEILRFRIAPPAVAALASLGRAVGATTFTTLVAILAAALRETCGQEDIAIGTSVSTRSDEALEPLIGLFLNQVVLRADVAGNPSPRRLLERMRAVVLDAFAHRQTPFDAVVAATRDAGARADTPLFNVLATLQNAPRGPIADLRVHSPDVVSAKFALSYFLVEVDDGIDGTVVYDGAQIDPAAARAITDRMVELAALFAERPDTPLNLLTSTPGADGMDIDHDAPRQRSAALKLGARKRRTIDLGKLDVAREYVMQPGGLPYVVEAALDVDLAAWIPDHAKRLDVELRRHGAVLFRGFRLGSADAFRRVQDMLCDQVIRGYGDLPEEKDTARQVYKSTPYPQDRTILFHNESSHQADWPVRQFFACVTAAEWGGETPIVDCRRVAERLGDAVVDEFERRGLVYIRTFIDGLDVNWRDFFKTDDRAEVERACERAGDEYHWFEDGTLQVRHAAQAVAYHPLTGERTFFNQVQLHEPYFLGSEERAALESMYGVDRLPRNVLYGDGSPIPPAVLDAVLSAYQDLAVAFPWQAGDMLMLDNMLVAHARNPFRGERKIIVGLGDPYSAMTRQTEDA